jgi:hypothetical protein
VVLSFFFQPVFVLALFLVLLMMSFVVVHRFSSNRWLDINLTTISLCVFISTATIAFSEKKGIPRLHLSNASLWFCVAIAAFSQL